jgi:hypothetical protein
LNLLEMIVTLLHPMQDGRSDARGAAGAYACELGGGKMMIMTGHPPRERTRAP